MQGDVRKPRRMRSSTVALGAMGTLALLVTSCGSEPDRRCVDPVTYKQLKDRSCRSGSSSSGGSSGGSYAGGKSSGRWYYGGEKNGSYVSGGSFDKTAVSRGGFGCSGSGGG